MPPLLFFLFSLLISVSYHLQYKINLKIYIIKHRLPQFVSLYSLPLLDA